MLDAFIIEEIKRREREEERRQDQDRPRVEIHIPSEEPIRPSAGEEEPSRRGVVIIDYSA